MWLILFAILAQGLDAYSTCHALNHGFRELNPILGNTCKSVITRKSLIVTPLLIWNNKYVKIGLIGSGAFGFTWNLNQIKRNGSRTKR